jgi:hypothetical protein
MITIALVPESPRSPSATYRAVAGNKQSVGRTMGEAVDALAAQLSEARDGALIVVQRVGPDEFFTAAQQQRLHELIVRWRAARDAQTTLSSEEQAELDALVEAEVRAATQRAAALIRGLTP